MSSTPSIILYTAGTPNGYKVSIALEELGLPYELKTIALMKNEQKEPWFLEINPNGRIPAITDRNSPAADGQQLHIFESGAILEYLVGTYDKEHKISYPYGSKEHWQTLAWLHFQMGGLGPMQGQANHFFRYAPEKIQYGIDRYQAETRRLYSVLNDHLQKHGSKYLVGDKLTIADIANFGWVRSAAWAGIEIDEFPALKAWEERIEAREAVQKGLQAPPGRDVKQKLTEEELEKTLAEARSWIKAPESKQ